MRWSFCFLCVFALNVIPCGAAAPTDYYNHVVFDNSITPDYYYYSSGRAVFPSTIELLSGPSIADRSAISVPQLHKNSRTGAVLLR